MGVAVKAAGKWLLHCGDSYYDRREISGEGNPFFGWKIFQKIVHTNYKKALENQKHLSQLYHSNRNEIEVICAHDINEFKNFNRDLE